MDDPGLEAISAATDLLGIYGVAIDGVLMLSQWLSQVEEPDPVIRSLNMIHAALNAIDDAVLGSWMTEREENLTYLRAHSTTALHTLNAFQQSGSPPSSDYWAPKLAIADRDSLIAVQTLSSDMHAGYWLRPYSLKAVSMSGNPESYDSGWMPHMADRAEPYAFNRVWDYRWALPTTIYAISARLAVARLLGIPKEAFKAEVWKYNQFMAHVFQKMESGVRSLKELSPSQIERIPVHGVPIAVADIYGGYFIGGIFDPFFRLNHPSFTRYPPLPVSFHSSSDLPQILENRKQATVQYESMVKARYGWEELLWFCGKLENFLAE